MKKLALLSEKQTTLRMDKWLWAARFFKTRTLASEAIQKGRVMRNHLRCKPAAIVRVNDLLEISSNHGDWQVWVRILSANRQSAKIAQTLYEETEESQIKRTQAAEQNKQKQLFIEPSAQLHGRPTKKERRLIQRFTHISDFNN